MTSSLPQIYRKKFVRWAVKSVGEERMKNIHVTTVLVDIVLLERRVRLPVDSNRLTGDGIPFLEARSNHGG